MGAWSNCLRVLAAVAAIGACGLAPTPYDDAAELILGLYPGYGPAIVTAVPNRDAIGPRIWVPDLELGYDPQGLTLLDGNLYVSGYKSVRFGVNRGPCRVYRLDPASGRIAGSVGVPSPCGHAGGLATAGDGRLYLSDTHSLFAVAPDGTSRQFPLGPGIIGAFAASAPGAVWIGSYAEEGPGHIFEFDAAALDRLPDGTELTAGLAAAQFAIPSHAQGAAFDEAGLLWVARSEFCWGYLDHVDLASGRTIGRYAMPGGIEGLAFAGSGRLWAVSEAGALHLPHYPFFPLIFGIDIRKLVADGT
jgi:sugar lactone lactonase YvrE